METVVLHAPLELKRVASKHARLAGTTVTLDTLRSRGVQREVNRRARAAAVFALVGRRHRLDNIWEPFPASTTRAHLAHRAAALLSAVRKLALSLGSGGPGSRARGSNRCALVLYQLGHCVR